MKTKNKISVVLLSVLVLLSSCNFLDEQIVTNLGKDQVFNTSSGIEAVMVGCYVNFQAYNGFGNTEFEMHFNSIILESGIGAGNVPQYSIPGTVTPTEYHGLTVYQNNYGTINQLNNMIENVQTSTVSDNVKKRYIAEAKFLRAICYFDLVRYFGRVPLRIQSTKTVADSYAPRAPMADIYKQILSDFTDAEAGMPTRELQAPERPNRMAATAYKAKVYLFLACMKQEHLTCCKDKETIDQFQKHFVDTTLAVIPITQLWQKCFDNAMTVKTSGVYELYPQYSQLWNGNTRNTKESILELQYGSIYGTNGPNFMNTTANAGSSQLNGLISNGNAKRNFAGKSTFCEQWKKYGNGKYFMSKRTFEPTDLTPAMNSDRETGCDPRINANYVYFMSPQWTNGDRTQPTLAPSFPNSSAGQADRSIYLRKYQNTNIGRGDVNLILFRYADVLLMLAEVANELDDKTTAINCVEEILKRSRSENSVPVAYGVNVGKIQPVSWDYENMSKDQMRLAIMQEREFELLGECQEFFDVRRRGNDYLKYRMDIYDKWWRRLSAGIGYLDPQFPDVWEGWSISTIVSPTQGDYGVPAPTGSNFQGNIAYLNPTKALFAPIPDKEFRLNIALTADDQNIGW